MYRGFNLAVPHNFKTGYYRSGKQNYDRLNESVRYSLEKYLLTNGALDGNTIMRNWFPGIPSHVFISHSHLDKEKAIVLAGMLYEHFNIIAFVDSMVWGNSSELQKAIDNSYCLNSGNSSYDYEKRNYSTAHVNLMLLNSLNNMIDSCECVIFLNSPNSISINDSINRKTNSPWIFSEIATSKIIHKRTPERLKRMTKLFSSSESLAEGLRGTLTIEYELELSHLTDLNLNDIENWSRHSTDTPEIALDMLYDLKPINRKFLI